MSLVSCDQKQISKMLDLKTKSLAIKIVSLKLPHTEDIFRLKIKIACRNDENLPCKLGLSRGIHYIHYLGFQRLCPVKLDIHYRNMQSVILKWI